MRTITVTVIEPNGAETRLRPADIPTDSGQLKALQDLVGGYIELVNLGHGSPSCLIVNEEGLMRQLPPNKEASLLAEREIYGTVVLMDRKDFY